ncbi:MAG TPA: hypothetical protein PL124_01285, partial [Candidatus Cloacimonadota bacterium]|nr:hypothetical protein [Candidatus Cloacimonadota bacterium]
MIYLMIGLGLLWIAGIWLILSRLGKTQDPGLELRQALEQLKQQLDGFDRYLRDEISRLRIDLLQINSANREELNGSITRLQEGLKASEQSNRTEIINSLTELNRQINTDAGKNREELAKALRDLTESISRRLLDQNISQTTQMDGLKTAMVKQMEDIRSANEKKLEEMR